MQCGHFYFTQLLTAFTCVVTTTSSYKSVWSHQFNHFYSPEWISARSDISSTDSTALFCLSKYFPSKSQFLPVMRWTSAKQFLLAIVRSVDPDFSLGLVFFFFFVSFFFYNPWVEKWQPPKPELTLNPHWLLLHLEQKQGPCLSAFWHIQRAKSNAIKACLDLGLLSKRRAFNCLSFVQLHKENTSLICSSRVNVCD